MIIDISQPFGKMVRLRFALGVDFHTATEVNLVIGSTAVETYSPKIESAVFFAIHINNRGDAKPKVWYKDVRNKIVTKNCLEFLNAVNV